MFSRRHFAQANVLRGPKEPWRTVYLEMSGAALQGDSECGASEKDAFERLEGCTPASWEQSFGGLGF